MFAKLRLLLSLLAGVMLLACPSVADDDETPPFGAGRAARTPPPPAFPHFEFAGHQASAEILSQFLWYHFHNRLHMRRTLFYHECLGLADLWMGGAEWQDSGRSIQEVHRRNLLGMRIDDDGYVHTHQHYSHAHEHGWPFPLWPQSGIVPDGFHGLTAGWHFQRERGPGGWIWDYLEIWKLDDYYGDRAVATWETENCVSEGIIDGKWRIRATAASPMLTSPAGVQIDAANAPFLQLRWKRIGKPPRRVLPYVEWRRAGDAEFSPNQRMYLRVDEQEAEHADVTGATHTMIPVYRHPKWEGTIDRIRLCLAPGESDVQVDVDAFFSAYDTRHPINNPIFVCASATYFNWTQDIDFLRRNINRMRTALRYQMTEMGGLEHDFIWNRWPGHDGLPGWERDADGQLTMHPGHGIGNNYFDLIPFGWQDCYSTLQYYGSLVAMAEIEEAVRAHPEWDVAMGALALDPDELRAHAATVKRVGNGLFWNEETGRFIACVDRDGNRRDYGFVWLNEEAIWQGFATAEHARSIMDWISGTRIVAGDTSTGPDIYRWRFGPRTTTLRNVDWYGQCWTDPGSLPFGGQVQDGGAALGYTFYDLIARLRICGADDAWQRLQAIVDWEQDVWAAGGYRQFYADGKQGTSLQGGGTAGGIGIDYEFFESSLMPSIVVYGFLGLQPTPEVLRIAPRLPSACPTMSVRNVRYAHATLNFTVSDDEIRVEVVEPSPERIAIEFIDDHVNTTTGERGSRFYLAKPGVHRFGIPK